MILYFVYQAIFTVPMIYLLIQDRSFQNAVFFAGVSLFTLLSFTTVAFTNPGFIQGSSSEVDRRAQAYDPDNYCLESERKKPSSFFEPSVNKLTMIARSLRLDKSLPSRELAVPNDT